MEKDQIPVDKNGTVITGTVLVILLLAQHTLFSRFFPMDGEGLGGDYAMHLPNLLSGLFWFMQNGWLSQPWFSPAQCGGVPFMGDMNVLYYSLPQYLTFVMMPVAAIYATFIIFSALGFIGFYLLARRRYGIGMWPALVGGALFMFNGFFIYRMVIGHLTFHAFMLTPFMVLALLHGINERNPIKRHLIPVLGAGAILAYMFHSGMVHAIPPVLLAVAVMFLIHAIIYEWRWLPWGQLAVAGFFALALSAIKLAAALGVMMAFPRDFYSLPGIEGLAATAWIAMKSVFWLPAVDEARPLLRDLQWTLNRHEFEYGITPIPLIIILERLYYALTGKVMLSLDGRRLGMAVTAVLLMTLPVCLNWYTPGWNGFLKELPFFGSSSTLVRWFSAYIPVFILLAILSLERLPQSAASKRNASIVLILSIAGINWAVNKDSYEQQLYDGRPIIRAYQQAQGSGHVLPIGGQAMAITAEGMPSMPIDRNNAMAIGLSQLNCYQPIFGYRLEALPGRPLTPGPAMMAGNDGLNVKNPACYAYAGENQCQPGDNFSSEQATEAKQFLAYRSYDFKVPWWQTAANWISLTTLVLMLMGVLLILTSRKTAYRDK
ncbi:MAG: hypothetical protein HQ504_06770 [Rhodospirillaceae bacterium]|nr:hypothetical protein [Rhodospirillaceae bacterium]